MRLLTWKFICCCSFTCSFATAITVWRRRMSRNVTRRRGARNGCLSKVSLIYACVPSLRLWKGMHSVERVSHQRLTLGRCCVSDRHVLPALFLHRLLQPVHIFCINKSKCMISHFVSRDRWQFCVNWAPMA